MGIRGISRIGKNKEYPPCSNWHSETTDAGPIVSLILVSVQLI
jgi:hypothetical protein